MGPEACARAPGDEGGILLHPAHEDARDALLAVAHLVPDADRRGGDRRRENEAGEESIDGQGGRETPSSHVTIATYTPTEGAEIIRTAELDMYLK